MSGAPWSGRGRGRVAALGVGLGVLVGGLVLAGCSAGQITQTDTQAASVNGAHGEAGQIAIRNAQLAYPDDGVYPAGGDAPLIASIVNTGSTPDELVEVVSPMALVQVEGDQALPGRQVLWVGTPGESADTQLSETSEPPTTTGSGPSETIPVPTDPIDVQGTVRIVLNALDDPLTVGQLVPVTFVFERAGSVTLQVPIATPDTVRTVSDSEHGEGGEH